MTFVFGPGTKSKGVYLNELLAECQKAFKNYFYKPLGENKFFSLVAVCETCVRYFDSRFLTLDHNWRGNAP